jgi:hypothetical protein
MLPAPRVSTVTRAYKEIGIPCRDGRGSNELMAASQDLRLESSNSVSVQGPI